VPLFHACNKKPNRGGYAAILIVHGKMSPTINIARSETVTEFSAVVGHSKDIKTNGGIAGSQCT
jgi:hypothetical protein